MGTGTVVGETEQAVPAYGLSGLGRGVWRLGGVSAELVVRGGKVGVGWRDAAGRAVRGVPACVRREQAGELGLLRAAVREIEEALGPRARGWSGSSCGGGTVRRSTPGGPSWSGTA